MKFWQSLQFTATRDIPALARAIEEQTPFHGIFLGDHALYPQDMKCPYPYTPNGRVPWGPQMHWPDIATLFGALALATRRLHYTTSIIILPLRHPFDVAKMMATASELSDNRAALGVGLGWMEDEFLAAGIDFRSRGKRCDEMIEVMRLLWQGRMVEHHGSCFDFPLSQLSPAPAGPVPIYVGGDSPAALRRAALKGDGWISSGLSPETIPASIATLRKLREEAGRGHVRFEFIATVGADLELIKRLEDSGVTAVFNVAHPDEIAGRATPAQQLDRIRRYADEIIAKI